MRVYTEIVISMVTGEVLKEEWFEYDGPVALCKGDSLAKSLAIKNDQRQQQAFDAQMAQLNDLKASFGKYLNSDVGFDPATMAAMQSGALNDNALAFDQAGNTVRDQITSMGGSGDLPIGGNTIGRLSSLSGMAASQKASTLNNLKVMNAQQALANRFNAGSILSGNAATLGGTIGSSASASGNALNAYINSKNQGFGAAFTHALGAGLGGGLASVATGGIGGMLGR